MMAGVLTVLLGCDPATTSSTQIDVPLAATDADFHFQGRPSSALVQLGQSLFFDKILSGNENISCGTCHSALTVTSDGLSLGIGEGGTGVGATRTPGVGTQAVLTRVPRHAPALFNLGAREFETLFWDGRVHVDPSQPSGFASPAGNDLPEGLHTVLAAQALFPITSADEMAGQVINSIPENSVAAAVAAGDFAGAWNVLVERLRVEPVYVEAFEAAYPNIDEAADIQIEDVANAIAAFEIQAFRADKSPFDAYLRGDVNAMSQQAINGMQLFYGAAKCASCHRGPFQTDHQFHAIAMPQIGPGKGDGYVAEGRGRDDFGRARVTAESSDRYRFRTPSLRNVALTGPWGHDGAYNSLKDVVLHHLDPVAALHNYDTSQAMLPPRSDLNAVDYLVHNDSYSRQALADANELTPAELTDDQVEDVLAFLYALTDRACMDLRKLVPWQVPSGSSVTD